MMSPLANAMARLTTARGANVNLLGRSSSAALAEGDSMMTKKLIGLGASLVLIAL